APVDLLGFAVAVGERTARRDAQQDRCHAGNGNPPPGATITTDHRILHGCEPSSNPTDAMTWVASDAEPNIPPQWPADGRQPVADRPLARLSEARPRACVPPGASLPDPIGLPLGCGAIPDRSADHASILANRPRSRIAKLADSGAGLSHDRLS